MSEPITVQCRDNGPFIIEIPPGGLLIKDAEDNIFPIAEGKERVALCRCGHSERKPFCDGAHKTSGFTSCERVQAGS